MDFDPYIMYFDSILGIRYYINKEWKVEMTMMMMLNWQSSKQTFFYKNLKENTESVV
jgi:hypothetical protein